MKTYDEFLRGLVDEVVKIANIDTDVASRIVGHVIFEYTAERNDVIDASGQYVDGRLSINLSSIWTKLIKEAGRVCERYASDLLIDIASVEEHLETFLLNNEEHTWLFGFRRDGVDGNSFIAYKGINSNEYRSVWSLTLHHLEHIGRDNSWFCMTLRKEK